VQHRFCPGRSVRGYILGSLTGQIQTIEPSLPEVRDELRRVLDSVRFRQSPRLSKLLRYICSSSLVGDAEQITEYTIALDVLGKGEDFKESKDAIVRVEVHRLRKRLTEYYEDEGRSNPIRIVIPAGKYVAQFLVGHVTETPRRSRIPLALAFCALILLTAAFAFEPFHRPSSSINSFWNPVLASAGQVLLVIGNESGGHAHPVPDSAGNGPLTLKEFHSARSQMVHVDDASTLAALAGLMQTRGKHYRIVSQSEATYGDLQRTPVVLIGLLNNEWTQRLVGQLRFSVQRPGPGLVMIRDRDRPARADWSIDFYKPFLDISRDYALVLRATDPKTEQMVVAVGGMSIFGTMAAAEFLTNENELRKLEAVAPNGWNRKNLELVLATDVIRGHPGPPTVVATHFW